jgi:hypothetical protein
MESNQFSPWSSPANQRIDGNDHGQRSAANVVLKGLLLLLADVSQKARKGTRQGGLCICSSCI